MYWAYNLCEQPMFRCAASMAGPGPAKLWNTLGKRAGTAAFSNLAHHLCVAWVLPSPDRRQLVPETLVNMKREREGSRGEEIYSTSQLSIYTPMERG